MKIKKYIQEIQIHLIQTHHQVLNYFEEEAIVKNYRPENQAWTISEILEHISLTSHFLLILIDKGRSKALRNIQNLSLAEELQNFHYDLEKLNEIGVHQSFEWVRPEHMEPQNDKSEFEVKNTLILQLNRCLSYLEELKNGEGLLYQTTMTVNDLGKLNVYEYIYFLSKHAERHISQIEANKIAFHK